jgi:hypothetical protein
MHDFVSKGAVWLKVVRDTSGSSRYPAHFAVLDMSARELRITAFWMAQSEKDLGSPTCKPSIIHRKRPAAPGISARGHYFLLSDRERSSIVLHSVGYLCLGCVQVLSVEMLSNP